MPSITNISENLITSVAIAGTSTNTSATSPGTMADDATVGTLVWTNPNNAMASDDADAIVSSGFGGTSHYLKATNFGFSIPTGATIDGILVEIEQDDQNTNVIENSIKIVKGGTISGDEKSTGAAIPNADAYVSYGSSSDLWGLSWTAEDINLSTFGVVFSIVLQNAFGGTRVDHIRITVYYTTAGTPATFVNLGMTDITVDEATMTVDEALRPVDALGVPVTKASKNNKSLTNMAENL